MGGETGETTSKSALNTAGRMKYLDSIADTKRKRIREDPQNKANY
jgi:hypothetical protein